MRDHPTIPVYLEAVRVPLVLLKVVASASQRGEKSLGHRAKLWRELKNPIPNFTVSCAFRFVIEFG